MTNKPQLDLRGITDAINSDYNRRDGGGADTFPAIPVTTVRAETTEPAPAQNVAPDRTITAPFIILEFLRSAEDETKIDSFTAYAEGVEASPEALISHLEMVVNTIKEQSAAAKAAADADHEAESAE